MKWPASCFDWNRARAFLLTAEKGSLSAAAKVLGASQTTVGRQVSALEKELGVALFERNSSGFELTPKGSLLLEYAQNMAEAANLMAVAARTDSDSLVGHVVISATEVTATFVLPTIIAELVSNNPGLKVELIASNRSSDLRRREADIAVRFYRPKQPELIARKIGVERYQFFAARRYVDNLPVDLSPENVDQLRFVGFDDVEQLISIMNVQKLMVTKDHFIVASNQHLANWELVKQGAGIGIMVDTIGNHEPLVVPVLTSIGLPESETWLVAHRDVKTNRLLRIVFDFLALRLSKDY